MSETKDGFERRRHQRFEVPVQVLPTDIFGKESRIQNISIGGVRVFCAKSVEINSVFGIKIALPNGEWFEAQIKVLWIEERSFEPILKYDIGCRFTEIPIDSQKILMDYLAKITPRID